MATRSPGKDSPGRKSILGVLSSNPRQLPTDEEHRFSFLYTLLNPYSQQWQASLFKKVIAFVILVDLLSFILETDEELVKFHVYFHKMEIFSSCLFLVEYIGRVATCVERAKYRHFGPVLGRIHFMLSPGALTDLLSMSPWFLEQLLGITLPRLTYLRLFRLLRITKTHGAVRATEAVVRVIKYNCEILYVAGFVCILLVMVTGVALYYLRPPNDGIKGQGSDEQFRSIATSMYLSTLMLTGQGGPEGDLPWYTKFIVLVTSIVSVAMFAIPASMLTWGFEAEAERMAKRAYALEKRRKENGSADFSDDDYSTDEEYRKIIAGEGDEEEEEGAVIPKELLEKFVEADKDGSGGISLAEFMKVSSSMSVGQESPVLSGMMQRVQQLERDVKANSAKLDRVLELLESKKDK